MIRALGGSGTYSLGIGFTLAIAVTSVTFGALHTIGWSLEFPSLAERMLWRISCLVLISYPVFNLLMYPPIWLLQQGNVEGRFASVVYLTRPPLLQVTF